MKRLGADMLQYLPFILGIAVLPLIYVMEKFYFRIFLIILSITLSGIILNMLRFLNPFIWVPFAAIFFIILSLIFKEIPKVEITVKEMMVILIIVLVSSIPIFNQGVLGTDLDFYIPYAIDSAAAGHLTEEITRGINMKTNITMPPLFNLLNTFLLQISPIKSPKVLQFITPFFSILLIIALFQFAKELKINILLIIFLIISDKFIFQFLPQFGRDLPFMVFSILFFLFLFKKEVKLALLMAVLCALIKIMGLFHILLFIFLFPAIFPLVILIVVVLASAYNPNLVSDILQFIENPIEEFIKGIYLSLEIGGLIHILYFPISVLITYLYNKRLFILGIITVITHAIIFLFPTGTWRYPSFLYPFELILVAFIINKGLGLIYEKYRNRKA